MFTAKVIESGQNQSVSIPREYRLNGTEVNISKIGDIVMLVPKDAKWEEFLNSLTMFSDDFLEERGTVDMEEREQLTKA
jgi:antitoxin VapB